MSQNNYSIIFFVFSLFFFLFTFCGRFIVNIIFSINNLIDTEYKKNEIRSAMKAAWKSYRDYAWGSDYLCPQAFMGKNDDNLSYTIVDSLDSLLIMGLHEEFQEAREWIEKKLDFKYKGDVSFFESMIRAVGGLVSTYEITNDKLFLYRAQELASRLIQSFDTITGLPRVKINLETGLSRDHSWAYYHTLLADAGSCQLELLSLSKHLCDPYLSKAALGIQKTLINLSDLPPNHISYETLSSLFDCFGFDAFGDSYYEYFKQ